MIICVIELLKSLICVKESVICKSIYSLNNEESLAMHINHLSECAVLALKANYFLTDTYSGLPDTHITGGEAN